MKKDRKINFKKLTQINQHVKPQPLKTHRSLLEALERRDVIGSLLPFFPGGGLTPSVAKSLNMSMSQAFARLNMGEQKIVADAFETLSAALRDSDVPSPLPPTADDSSAAGSTQSVSSSWDGLSSQGDYVANLASAEDVAIDLSVDLQAESLNFSTDRVANLPSLNSLSSLKGTSVSMQKTPASPTFSAAGNGAPNLDGVRPTPLQTQGSQGNFNSSYQDSSETAAETDQSTAFSSGGSLKNDAAPVAETPNAGAEPSSDAADADAPRANTEKVAFAYDLSDWTVSESGGSEQGRGSVAPIAQGALMAEGDSFVVEMRKTFVMTGEVDALSFAYEASFDASSTGLVKDAFEAALVDSEGYSLVKTFNRSRDSFFNLTEGLEPALGSQTTLSDESGLTRVTLDISSVPVGTECNLVFRLVNNDADAGGWVKIFAEKGQSGGAPEIMPFEVAETVEGAVVSLSADFIDSDAGEAHVATIDWGDGTVEAVAVVPTETGGTVSGEHIYADNGQYEATVSVIDAAGMGAARSTTVAVANAAPEMTDITTSFDGKMNANGTVDQYVVLAGTFTDPGFTNAAAGTEETFVLSVDWGDGTVEEYEPDVTQGGPAVLTVGEYSLRHSYRQGGIYTAVVTVRDDDGGEDAKESKFGYGEIEICLATTYPVVKPSRVKIPVNPSIRHGEIPVIVKSVGNLDATALNVSSVRFYPGDASDSNSQLIAADVDPFADGIADAIFHFSTTDAFIRPTDKIGWLTANFDDGTPFFGFDTIKATPISGAVSEAYDPRTAADSNTRFFVLDGEQDAVYRYTAEGRENSDFVLSDATPDVRDVTANVDGSKLWIVDGISRSVQTRSPDGWLLGAWRAVDVYSPQGIATNGTDIWIIDNLLHGVMRYDGAANLFEGNRTADAFFSLSADNIAPTGMATDGEKIWVSDSYADKIFVYDAFAGNLLGYWSLAPENGFAAGVTNDPTGESDSIWVVDSETLNVYEYAAAAALLTGTAVLAGTFALAEGNTRPVGIVDPAVISTAQPSVSVAKPTIDENYDVDSVVVVTGTATPGQSDALDLAYTVDFEMLPSGQYAEGESIADQYAVQSGVAFSTPGIDPATLALVGGEQSAFESQYGVDTIEDANRSGMGFLTFAAVDDPRTPSLRIDLTQAAGKISGDLYDVDSDAETSFTVFESDGTPGWYNDSLGTILDGTSWAFPISDDPTYLNADEPDLSPAADILGDWLTADVPPKNGNWKWQSIPTEWEPNTENAIVYEIDGGPGGIANLKADIGVDNGVFIWLNGEYVFGAMEPGSFSSDEYAGIDFGSLRPGKNYLQVLREDHGSENGFTIKIYGETITTEAWRVDGLDAFGGVVASTTIDMGAQGVGDGGAAPWELTSESADIVAVEFTYVGNKKTSVDVGLDNLNFYTPKPSVTVPIVAVYVNNDPVDVLDVAGNYFYRTTVEPGLNEYVVTAIDANGGKATTSTSVWGTTPRDGTVENLQFDVSPSFKPDYARTSFDDRIGVLYAQLAIENVGQYVADAPFYVGVRNISDMNVVALDPCGVTKDGISYYDVSDSIQGGALNPNDKTLWVDISFLNPGRNRFTYELVYVYKTNEAPIFVTAPGVEAYPGKAYSYASRATDPNRDPLTYSLVVGPDGMTVDAKTGDVAWTPTDLGVYSVVLRVEDGRGGSATQTYAINVVDAPENRPPVITSYPPTSATVVNYKQVPGGKIVVAADEWTLSDDGFWNDYEDTATFVENVARWFTDGETGNFLALSENFGLRGDALANVMISNGHQWTGMTETPTLEELLEYDGVFLGGNTVPDNQLLIDYVNAGGCVYLCGGTYNVNETRDWGVFLEAFGLGFYGRINPDGDAWNHIYGVIPIDAKPHPIFENVSALYQRDGHDIVDLDESDSKGVFVATINGMGQYAVYDSAFDVAEAGSGYVYQVEAYEPDGDTVTYSLGLSPEGMWINPNNGAISWAPTVDQIGENVVTVIATDEHGATDTQTYSIMVYADPNNHDPIIISEPTTVIVSNQTEICDLSDWRQIVYESDDYAPNWVLSNNNTTASQEVNAKPSILLSDFNVLNREISGSWKTTDSDDDFMGFVFGYQDEGHFYLFDWKGEEQDWKDWGVAEKGMSVKRVNTDGTIAGAELWNTNGNDSVTTLYHNSIGWERNVEYTFSLVFKNDEFMITVSQGDVILDVITLTDDAYEDGKFGFYNFSQAKVYYNGFYQKDLDYNYTVVAVDPDDDDITYELLYGPENSSINPQTGELTWITELGSYSFTVLASDGHGGTDVQSFVVNVVEPGSGTISGYIVNDANANGEQDTDEGYLANHVVWLDQNQNGRLDSNEISTKSDSNGYYEFTNLPSGAYFVRYQEANGWIQTFPSEGTESADPSGGSCGVDPSKNWSFKTPRIYEGNSVCVTTEQDVVDGNDGLVSLREAIQQAEEGDTITFAKELQGKSIVLNGSQLAVTKTIMVDASGIWDSNKNLPGVTIDGNKQSRIFNVESNATLSLVGIKMTNGSSPIGGAIYSYGDLTVSNCSFEGNYAGGTHPPYGGGAISMAKEASTLTISSSYFYQNRAYDNGGAIYNQNNVDTFVEDSCFEGNIASGFWASSTSALLSGGRLSIKNSRFTRNEFTGSETIYWATNGAAVAGGGEVDIDGCVFEDNLGIGFGISGNTVANLKNSYFINNSNPRNIMGAGIGVQNATLNLYNCTIIQDAAEYDCPCIRQDGGNVNLYNSIVIGEGVSKTVDSSASINAYNTLSDYQAWSNASNNDVVNYVYDPTQPLFAADGVYLPSEDSQALDKGDNQFVVTDYDICGANRISNGTVDLGPWERIIQSENNDGRFDKKGYVVLLESGQSVTDRNFGATSSEDLDVGALTIVSTPPNTATVGEVYRYDVQTINPSGSVLDFTLLSAPSGMGIHHDLGTIVWRPTNADVGEYQAVVKVCNANGEVATQAFTVAVEAANHAPVITTDAIPTPVLAASPYRAYIYAQDADNDALTYSLVGAPDGMTIAPDTGVLDWTPEAALIGSTVAATVVVTDARGKSAKKTYNLAVVETLDNDAPIITSTPRTRTRMELPYVYLVQAYDPNGDRLTFSVSGISADGTPLDGITCDSDTGLIQWTPSAADQGTATVAVSVSDGRGGVATQTYALDIITLAENTAPRIISTPVRTGIVGKTWRYNAEAVDVDGDFVYWRLKDAPDGASINIETGEIVWVPTYQQLAANLFTVVCTDIYGASTEQTFTVTVRGINRPPVIFSAPNSAAATEFNYVYAVRAKDADGDELRFSLVDGAYPEGMTIDESLGLVRWTPSAADAGLHFVTIQVDDGVGGIDTQTYSINVIDSALNNPPVITSTPTVAASVGLKYSYRVVAKDPEGDKVTYALEEGPEGAIFNASTGQFEWSPAESDIGNVRIVFTATDLYGKRAVQSYTLTVAPNQAPTIVSTPPTSAVPDAPYSYDVQASDPEGDAITYALVQGPEGMTVDEYGRLRWTPAASFMNVNVSVTVAAIDSYSNVAEQRFTVSVGEDVDAPQVRLICDRSVVKPGEEFTVQVQAIDNVGVASVSLLVNGVEQPLVWNAKSQLYTAQLQFANVGEYEVYATAVDAAGNVGQSDVAALRASEHAELPQVTFHAIYPQVYNDEVGGLVDGEPIVGDDILLSPVITYLTDVDLSIFDDNMGSWIIDFAPVSAVDLSNIDQHSDAYRVLEEGSGVLNHHRVRIDPTILANDAYILRVQAYRTNGIGWVTGFVFGVEGAAKLGQFAFSTTDMSISRNGISLVVQRAYDTARANEQGDFGYGWSLSICDPKIAETTQPGTEMVDGDRVYITTPDGDRIGFTYKPDMKMTSGMLAATLETTPRFEADPGVEWSLACLETPPIKGAGLAEAFLSIANAMSDDKGIFNPSNYVLTSKDGTAYYYKQKEVQSKRVDEESGLYKIVDPNGIELTVTKDGINHSAGGFLTFERDARGRITSITDHMDMTVTYKYDASGDLVAFSNQIDSKSNEPTITYKYRKTPAHFLDEAYDKNGDRVFKAEFDEDGRLVGMTDALGNVSQQEFDPGAMNGITRDANGNVTTVWYDERGNVTLEEKPVTNVLTGETTVYTKTYDYGDERFPDKETRVVDYNGTVTEYVYDDAGNQARISITSPDGTTSVYSDKTYDGKGNVTSMTMPGVSTFACIYDECGNAQTILLGNNEFNSTHNSDGSITSITNGNGDTSTYEYADGGERHGPCKITWSDGSYEVRNYNENGMVVLDQYFDADGMISKCVSTTYDEINRKTTEITGQGNAHYAVSYEYDGDSDRVAVEKVYNVDNPSENDATYSYYDKAGNLIRKVDPGLNPNDPNAGSFYKYDGNGNLVWQKDPVGNVTTWIYDSMNRVVEERDSLYWAEKNVDWSSMTDKEILALIFAPTSPAANGVFEPSHTIRCAYDGADNIVEKVDQNGRRISYAYDYLGNQTSETWYDETDDVTPIYVVTYGYDENGRMTSAVSPDAEYALTYNDMGYLKTLSVDYPWSANFETFTISYEYDAMGNVVSQTDSTGLTVRSEYNGRNMLSSRWWEGAGVDGIRVDFTYNVLGNITSVTRWADTARTVKAGTSEYTYDLAGRATGITHKDALGKVLADYDYEYDFANRLVEEALSSVVDGASRTAFYDYDELGQLISAMYDNGQTNETFAWDANGNSKAPGAVIGAGNRLLSDGTFNYQYDFAGNMIAKTRINSIVGEANYIEYKYDYNNRLVAVDEYSSKDGVLLHTETYRHDMFGRRVQVVSDGTETISTFDGIGELANEWARFDAAGNVIQRFLFGGGVDQLIAQWTPDQGVLWALTDRLGSVRDLMNNAGVIQAHMNYTAFGSPILIAPNAGFAKYLASHPYAFTGRTWDSIANMSYFRARTFDPMTGRFTSVDPLRFEAGDLNLYRYLANSPFMGTDPSGCFAEAFTSYLFLLTTVIGGAAGYVYGLYEGHSGEQLMDDILNGAASGLLFTPFVTAYCPGAFLAIGVTFIVSLGGAMFFEHTGLNEVLNRTCDMFYPNISPQTKKLVLLIAGALIGKAFWIK